MIRAEAVPRVNQDLMESWNVRVRSRHASGGLDLWDLDLPDEMKAPPHEHLRPFFCFVVDGWIENDYGRRRIAFHPLLNVFHPAGTVHATVAAQRGARVLTLEVSPDWERRVDGLVTLPDVPTVVPFDDGAWLARRLLREMASPESCSALIFEGIALELLAAAGRASLAERSASPWLRRAIEQIHDRFSGAVTLHEVAADLGVHPARLSSEFRRYTGRAFGDYVRDLRVGFVKERLSGADAPLADIALRAGFADQAHCTRVFKAATGWTPGRYRMAVRSGALRPPAARG